VSSGVVDRTTVLGSSNWPATLRTDQVQDGAVAPAVAGTDRTSGIDEAMLLIHRPGPLNRLLDDAFRQRRSIRRVAGCPSVWPLTISMLVAAFARARVKSNEGNQNDAFEMR